MKLNKTILIISIVLLSALFSSCRNSPDAQSSNQPDYIEISANTIDRNAETLDLKGKNITDISFLYSMDNLLFVDLRDIEISVEDIENFINAKPGCHVVWSVPLGDLRFDSSSDTISLPSSVAVTSEQLEAIVNHFDNLSNIKLTNSSISADEYNNLKDSLPQINFELTITICGNEYSADTSKIDLTDCEDINEDAIISSLKYFGNIESVLFGNAQLSDTLKSNLLEQYPDCAFDWQTQLIDTQYSSAEEEIDISGVEITDFEKLKTQLAYFCCLSYIDMCDCGLTNMQMEELIADYPGTKFVWKIKVGSWEMRTDVKAFGTCYSEDFEGGSYVGGSGSRLEDYEAANLKYCTDLIALDIGHQGYINDFSFLKEMPHLKYLIVALSRFEDTSFLVDMKELEYLEIFNTNVSDLSPLLELPNLKYLNCSQIPIPNVDYLVDMSQLEVLWLCNAEYITQEEAARLEQSLPDCYVNTTAQGSTRGGWRSYDNQGYIDMREALNMPLAFW